MKSQAIIDLHTQKIQVWKNTGIRLSESDFAALVEQNHAFNYQLWHAEDRARRDDMGYEFVYHAKREIDHCNQQRNNRMEAMDQWLWEALNLTRLKDCPVHSETPGMMIDRLSIMALKAFHMRLQTERTEVDPSHRQQCQQKYTTILEQQLQLGNCLDQLLLEVQDKTRTFKVYFQFKMYNDPNLNPQLYHNKS